MKKIIYVILLFLLFPITSCAITKDDVLNTTKIEFCDKNTEIIYDNFKSTLSKLFNEKNISNEDLDSINSNVKKIVKIIKNNNICSIDKYNILKESKKNQIKKYAKEAIKIIEIAPNSDLSDKTTKIVFNRENKSLDVYYDGIINNQFIINNELNNVGLNIIVKSAIYVFLCIFLLGVIIKLISSKYESKLLNKIALIIMISGGILLINTFLFRNSLSNVLDRLDRVVIPSEGNNKNLLLDDNHTIISYPSLGTSYGTLTIKDKSIDIFYGDSSSILKNGVGHKSSSYFPGEKGKIVYSLHNRFAIIDELSELKKNSIIEVKTNYGTFKYKVTKTATIDNNDLSILKNNNKQELVLYTCYPFNNNLYSNKRYVIYATIDSESWVS